MKFENRFPPPFLVAGLVIVMAAAKFLLLPHDLPPAALAAGTIVALAGLAITVTAARKFFATGTTINPVAIEKASKLVTGGIFRWTRNPMYLGMVLILAGFAIGLDSAWLLVSPLAFALFIQRFQIRPEEQVMRQKFGAAFEDYCLKTRRWI